MKNYRISFLAYTIILTILLAACSGAVSVENSVDNNVPNENASAKNKQIDNESGDTIPAEIETAPDFTLPDKNWELVSLEDLLQTNNHVVVVFYFAFSCPPCMEQLREIENDLTKYEEIGAKVVAIAVQGEKEAEMSDRTVQAHFPILADKDHAVAEAYGVFDGGLSMPSVFIINQEHEVIWGRISVIPSGCGKDRIPSQSILEKINDAKG